MTHPFSGLEPRTRRRLAWPLALATVACFAGLFYTDTHLRTAECPNGIVGLELARDPFPIHRILASWNERPDTNLWAAFGLGIDYLFLALYSSLLALGCAAVADRFGSARRAARDLGLLLAWGQWVAAAADGVENAALFGILLRDPHPALGPIAFACALLKFALIGAGLAYILAGLAASRSSSAA
jgi:hypothetical protein